MTEAGRRNGFTLVEAMTAMLVVSTLARIAVPQMQELTLRARAAEVVGAIRTVEVAVMNHYASDHYWPDDAWPGEVPPELVEELPDGFSFQRGAYELDWENWRLPDGLPRHPQTRVLLGVSVKTDDPDLGNAISDLVGDGRGHFTLDDSYTFVLEGL